MKIVVTGGSGFVGGRIACALAAAGHDVVSYGRRPASAVGQPVPGYCQWDFDDPPPVDSCEAVVHAAALVGDWGRDTEYERANVMGTERVLRAFPHASRFVHVSTSSVYSDDQRKVALREDAPVGDCLTAYGRTKAAAESVVTRERPDAVILRPHIVYGPGDATLFPRLAQAIRLGRIPVPGTGRNLVSVTHVDNVVHAVERSLEVRQAGAFNIADEAPVMLGALLETVFARTHIRGRPLYIPRRAAWGIASVLEAAWPSRRAPRGPLLTRWVVAHMADEHTLDISRARALLGYAPRWTHVTGPLGVSWP